MKAREYKLLERCVEEGLPFAFRKAFKHATNPPEWTDDQKRLYERAATEEIMNVITEWFEFSDEEE